MTRLSLILVAALLAAACSNSPGVTNVVPPPPGIARVVLVSDSGTTFTGRAIPGQRFVAQVLDSAGKPVTNATLSFQTSAGWTLKGDTVIAPASEGVGTVKVTASRLDPSSAS